MATVEERKVGSVVSAVGEGGHEPGVILRIYRGIRRQEEEKDKEDRRYERSGAGWGKGIKREEDDKEKNERGKKGKKEERRA